jgi:hypothetical protein
MAARESFVTRRRSRGLPFQADYLRCKVRYFSDGAVLGGKNFVEGIFQACRERFGPKRRNGARPLRGLAATGKDESLFNFRQLRKGVFG